MIIDHKRMESFVRLLGVGVDCDILPLADQVCCKLPQFLDLAVSVAADVVFQVLCAFKLLRSQVHFS